MNLAALDEDLRSRRTVWRSRPGILEYATTSACNLRCPMCAQADPERRVQNTPREQRVRVFDQLFPSTTMLKPFSLSEPLLNDLEELAPHLARHEVKLDVVTNASFLSPRNLELLLPHLHRITFSVDSHIKEIFERVRPPAVFEEVDRNIKHAMPRLKAAGVEAWINMVLVREALPHLPEFVDYVVDEYGCEYMNVFELVPYMSGAADMDPFTDPGAEGVARALERMVVRAQERRLSVNLVMRAPFARSCFAPAAPPPRRTSAVEFEETHQAIRQRHPGFCEQAMTYLKVNPDGESYPCCKAPPELRLGNVFTDSLEGVWNSPAAQRLRRGMFLGDYPEPCRDCVFFSFTRSTGAHELPHWRRRLAFEVAEIRQLPVRVARVARDLGTRSRRLLRGAARRTGRVLGLPRILG